MLKFGLDMLVAKYSHDAEKEILKRQRDFQQRRVRAQRRERILKGIFVVIALAGVMLGIYCRNELGALAANLTSQHLPDPSLRAPPKSTAKFQRRLAEIRRAHAAELEEVTE